MDNLGLIGIVSIISSALSIGIGAIGPAIGEGMSLSNALRAIAQQPDKSNTITRTLFVGMAFIESTAIYAFVISIILIFANPFWNHFVNQGGG